MRALVLMERQMRNKYCNPPKNTKNRPTTLLDYSSNAAAATHKDGEVNFNQPYKNR